MRLFGLFGWAFHCAVAAEHTAVTWLGRNCGTAFFAFIEMLASVNRHLFFLFKTAFRTGYRGFNLHKNSRSIILSTPTILSYSHVKIWAAAMRIFINPAEDTELI